MCVSWGMLAQAFCMAYYGCFRFHRVIQLPSIHFFRPCLIHSHERAWEHLYTLWESYIIAAMVIVQEIYPIRQAILSCINNKFLYSLPKPDHSYSNTCHTDVHLPSRHSPSCNTLMSDNDSAFNIGRFTYIYFLRHFLIIKQKYHHISKTSSFIFSSIAWIFQDVLLLTSW